jgi:hypothetical protein
MGFVYGQSCMRGKRGKKSTRRRRTFPFFLCFGGILFLFHSIEKVVKWIRCDEEVEAQRQRRQLAQNMTRKQIRAAFHAIRAKNRLAQIVSKQSTRWADVGDDADLRQHLRRWSSSRTLTKLPCGGPTKNAKAQVTFLFYFYFLSFYFYY